ncbi:MAG: hypothetical protein GXO54_02560 [Chloroflexi bacterium]|nr:hypothetical protein [Chloroflexota bacterium]
MNELPPLTTLCDWTAEVLRAAHSTERVEVFVEVHHIQHLEGQREPAQHSISWHARVDIVVDTPTARGLAVLPWPLPPSTALDQARRVLYPRAGAPPARPPIGPYPRVHAWDEELIQPRGIARLRAAWRALARHTARTDVQVHATWHLHARRTCWAATDAAPLGHQGTFFRVAVAVARDGATAAWSHAGWHWPDQAEALLAHAAEDVLAWLPRRMSATPDRLPPRVPAVLLPEAVAALLHALAPGWAAPAVQRGHSWLLGRQGTRAFAAILDLWDDPLMPVGAPEPFDGEGVARRPLALVQHGVVGPVTHHRASAARAGQRPTGHGWPPSARPRLPFPRHLVLRGAQPVPEATLVSTMGQGMVIRRLGYIRALDPRQGRVFAVTRDGVWWIAHGRRAHWSPDLALQIDVPLVFARVRHVADRARWLAHDFWRGAWTPAILVDELPMGPTRSMVQSSRDARGHFSRR